MKASDLGLMLLAAGAAFAAFHYVRNKSAASLPQSDNLLPAGAFTEYTPVFASELPPEQQTPGLLDLWT